VAATAGEAAAAAVETRCGGGSWNEIGDLRNRPRVSGSGGKKLPQCSHFVANIDMCLYTSILETNFMERREYNLGIQYLGVLNIMV
jgi:hypothetical protein